MNLIFDIDDTLYNQLNIFENAYNEVFETYENFNIEDIFKANIKYASECFEKKEAGTMTTEEMYRYRIRKAFSDYDVFITEEDTQNFQQAYMKHQKLIEITKGMEKVLDYCKNNNITVGVITNGPEEHQRNKVNFLNLHRWFNDEEIFISGTVKIAKPDVRLFKHVEDKLNLNPNDTYYVGDSINMDILGAKNAGWNMIWINRMNNKLPNDFPVKPDYIINNDEDLLHLIKDIKNRLC